MYGEVEVLRDALRERGLGQRLVLADLLRNEGEDLVGELVRGAWATAFRQ